MFRPVKLLAFDYLYNNEMDEGEMAAGAGPREYEKTHPWISFKLNTNDFDYAVWLLLGEAKSKCEHISGIPVLPDVQRELYKVYLAKGALATTAIEGNTLTEEEVKQRIEGELKLPPSKEYLGKEIDNIVKAINEIGNPKKEDSDFRLKVEEIKKYNTMILKDLPLDSSVKPGSIRNYSVGIADYRGAPPQDCEYLLEKYVEWLNTDWLNNRDTFQNDYRIIFGILKAIIAHLYFVWIHPFGDGNGRTARLIEFQILLSSGVPTIAAHLLSNHYNITRSEYYRQLQTSSKNGGDLTRFIKYSLQGFVDGLRAEIDRIRTQQMYVHMVYFIHQMFRDKDRQEDKRRRALALELVEYNQEVPIKEIHHIFPKIAERYSTLSSKTILRDVNLLERMGLIKKTSNNSVQVNWEYIQAFLPPVLKNRKVQSNLP